MQSSMSNGQQVLVGTTVKPTAVLSLDIKASGYLKFIHVGMCLFEQQKTKEKQKAELISKAL